MSWVRKEAMSFSLGVGEPDGVFWMREVEFSNVGWEFTLMPTPMRVNCFRCSIRMPAVFLFSR